MDIQKLVAEVTEQVFARMNVEQGNPAIITANQYNIPGCIEHSLLNPDTTRQIIEKGCADAKKYRFANICVTPYFSRYAVELLKGSGVKVCVPVGFPHSAASLPAKMAEVRECIQNGVDELDVTLNFVAIKSGEYDAARAEFEQLVKAASGKVKVKAIYEQGILSEEERVKALTIADTCGADFVKISNALTGKKALAEDVKFVRSIVGRTMQIKIDGGIKDVATVVALLDAGANRVGCSASVAIAEEALKMA